MFNCSLCSGKSICNEWLILAPLCTDCLKIKSHIKGGKGIKKKVEATKKLSYSDIVQEIPII